MPIFYTLIATAVPPQLDKLAVFGFLSAVIFLTCLTIAHRGGVWYSVTCITQLNLAIYALLTGAWPVGLVMIALAVSSLRHWRFSVNFRRKAAWYLVPQYQEILSTRAERLFGESPSHGRRHRPHESDN